MGFHNQFKYVQIAVSLPKMINNNSIILNKDYTKLVNWIMSGMTEHAHLKVEYMRYRKRSISKQLFSNMMRRLLDYGFIKTTEFKKGRPPKVWYDIDYKGIVKYLLSEEEFLLLFKKILNINEKNFKIENKDFLDNIKENTLEIFKHGKPETLYIFLNSLISKIALENEPFINECLYKLKDDNEREKFFKRYNIGFKKSKKKIEKPKTKKDLILLMLDIFNRNLNIAFNLIYKKERRKLKIKSPKQFLYTSVVFGIICAAKDIENRTTTETLLSLPPYNMFPD